MRPAYTHGILVQSQTFENITVFVCLTSNFIKKIGASTLLSMYCCTFRSKWILACLYEVKECLCDTPGAREQARDQHVQFMRVGQFLSNCKG